MRKLISLALSIPFSTFAFADAGPSGNPETDWTYCIQESIKAEVWSRPKRVTPEQAVRNAYRSCRPEFKIFMATLPDDAARNNYRNQIAQRQGEDLDFARRMAKLRK